MDLGLRDRACIVTGATRGIGLAVARTLCEEGARVLFVGRDPHELARVCERCGGDYLVADVTDPEADELIVATCREQLGRVDVLVNNAGTSFARPLEDLTDDDWQAQWELHVMGPMRLMRLAAPLMAERGWGRIVNVSSSAGKRPSQTNAAYSVTKAAQLSLSRVFAEAYAERGVLVNAVAPGPVTTPVGLDVADARRGGGRSLELAAGAGAPLGRFGTPDEIASVVVFLCSERASDVAGAAWSVDGGTVASIV
jgi:3-oxoacyl-[acyl-carrier protein] reductase